MAAGSTYTPIATTTLGSAAASYTFSSIPSTYTDLVLVVAGTAGTDETIGVRFNGDTGNNYSETAISGDGSSATSFRETNLTRAHVGTIGSTQSVSIINIMNYSNTTTNKTVLGRGNYSGARVRTWVALWRNTAAINTVYVDAIGATFAAGSTFTLYGIQAA